MTTFIEPADAAGRALFTRGITGPVVMLNMLRFRPVADYSHAPHLAPAAPISGAEAYDRYVRHTLPYLEESGGAILFDGTGGDWFIGPAAERWDRILLIRQASLGRMLEMAMAPDSGYQSGLGHRVAALEDSRILPVLERATPSGMSAQATDALSANAWPVSPEPCPAPAPACPSVHRSAVRTE